ncbi:Protein DEHYDRATION-INDUCED 19 like 3 [Glycine soja]|uniref:Protein DEHYDRATION-INDUCED 19 like 3 n=1 Tax=Glycine soja TaxID=3848 RepID=A0A0B2QKX5_GLYSO|nr:Protein DEHYDRATION-INDUCED 19 like 3 [Glycine soja]
MEDETLSFVLSTASRSYQSRLKSHFELFIDLDEVNGDEELRTAYPCPFCAENFDLLELCCHVDLDHPIEAKSGICPVCTLWIGTNMVHHIAAQHGNLLKISFLVYCLIEIHLKSKCYKDEPYPALYFSSKGERDGHWQSFSTGLSPTTSKAASDPWLSFLCGPSAVDECENVQPDSSSEVSIEEIHSNDNVLERDVQPSLSDKDQIEKAQHIKFVQGLLMSTILDPDF